jgi:hypothetical protein
MAKALTLLQPYASLCVMDAKRIETRGYSTKYRGELLIHSSLKTPAGMYDLAFTAPFFRDVLSPLMTLPQGYILGKVTLYDIKTTEELLATGITAKEKAFGDYRPNRYGWLLKDAVKFDKPIPARGALSIWEWRENVAA